MPGLPIRVFLVLLVFFLISPPGWDPVAGGEGEARGAALAMAKGSFQTRAVEVARDVRFIAYNDGTVLDTRTGLMWAAQDNGSNLKWAEAGNYCREYRGGGYTDWRMPTQDELAGLYDEGENQPCNGKCHLTPLIDLTDSFIWASDKRGSDVAFFSFSFGGRYWRLPTRDEIGIIRALPVRAAQ